MNHCCVIPAGACAVLADARGRGFPHRRLTEIGDADTVAILDVILAEEVGHVRIGSHWYGWLCAQRGVDPLATSRRLLAEQGMNVRPPINRAAREAAGFGDEELRYLLQSAGQ